MFHYTFFTLCDLCALSHEDLTWLLGVCNSKMLSSAYMIAKYVDTVPGFIDAAAAVVKGYEGCDYGSFTASCSEYLGWLHSMMLAKTLAKLYMMPMETAVNERSIEADIQYIESNIEHKDMAIAVLKIMGVEQ